MERPRDDSSRPDNIYLCNVWFVLTKVNLLERSCEVEVEGLVYT